MNFDLSKPILGLDGKALPLTSLNKDYPEGDLTIGWALAHICAFGVEDLTAVDQGINEKIRQQVSAGVPIEVEDLKKTVFQEKVRRGNLAIKLSGDVSNVSLEAEEVVMLKQLAGPRFVPLILAQIHAVIN